MNLLAQLPPPLCDVVELRLIVAQRIAVLAGFLRTEIVATAYRMDGLITSPLM